MRSVTELLNQYGYVVLFVSLLLELIAFPIPGEALMTYCGFMVGQNKLDWILSIIVSSAGVITGITISYFIGRLLGRTFFRKYGHYVHLGPDKLEKIASWFDKYGDKLLIFAYFIPGVRHITGYFSGISGVSYKKFAIYAYTGAIAWTATFISLGKILGANWKTYGSRISRYLIIFSIIAVLILTLIFLYKKYREQLIALLTTLLQNAVRIFHSPGKVKFIIAGATLFFLILSGLVIGGVQDLLAHDYGQFDMITTYLIEAVISERMMQVMNVFYAIASFPMLLIIAFISFVFVMRKSADKFFDFRFIIINIAGGEILQLLLRILFRRIGPSGMDSISGFTYPSQYTFMTITVYGFFCYFITRYTRNTWIRVSIISITIVVALMSGLGTLFQQSQFASDVYAGYIFGGVWLTLDIILLEIYRILQDLNKGEKNHSDIER